MDLPSIDLNLLVTLHSLLTERSVTRAGETIGLSQPATSAALGKLRRHFGDELLIRDGQRFVLTPLATSLLDQADIALRYVERTFAARPLFDPQSSSREFNLVMSDYSLTVLGGPLLALLEQRAPNVRLRIRPVDLAAVDDAAMLLRSVDLMVLPRGFLKDLPSTDLYRDRWVCVTGVDNADVGDRVTQADCERLRWIQTYDRPTQFTPADHHLQLVGIERDVDVVIENFFAIPFSPRRHPPVAILQERLARKLQASAGVRVVELETELPELVEAIWWQSSRESDPGHRWLHDLVVAAAASLQDPLATAPLTHSTDLFPAALTTSPENGNLLDEQPHQSRPDRPSHPVHRSAEPAAQLQWLVDRAQISDLLVEFARTLDERDWRGNTDLYVPEGVMSVGSSFRLEGHDQLMGTGSDRGLGQYAGTWHLSSNHAIEIDGDDARTRSYLLGVHMLGQDQFDHADGGGWYDCTLRRTPDGWRFVTVAVREIWNAGQPLPHTRPAVPPGQ